MTENKVFQARESKEVKCRAEVPLLSVDITKVVLPGKIMPMLAHSITCFHLNYYD